MLCFVVFVFYIYLFIFLHCFPKSLDFSALLAEVTVPVSMKEVGGYIEKQVAYLSGEFC